MKEKPRAAARAKGLKIYFNGKACPRGHVSMRRINGLCSECIREDARERYRNNREKLIAYNKNYAKENPNVNYKAHLKRAYGISYAEYEALLLAQNHRCGICGSDDPQCKNNRWHLDHCHETGAVRGILCRPCNQMLGLGRDNPAILLSAIDYLNGERASGYSTASALLSFGG